MVHFNSAVYRNATTAANKLLELLCQCNEPTIAAAHLARVWIEVESYKRELRGIGRLSPASAREMLAAKREEARTIEATSTAPAFTEPDAPSANN